MNIVFVDGLYSAINTIERDKKVVMKQGRKNDIDANEPGGGNVGNKHSIKALIPQKN